MPDNAFTLLSFSGIGVAPYATRGATQTLTPIQQSAFMLRTINGALDDLSLSQFRKYASTISCNDQISPAFDGAWPGKQITVNCCAELAFKTAGGSPDRSVVPGSVRTEGEFTYYRPQLIMRITMFDLSTDEWGAQVGWSMSLEEV